MSDMTGATDSLAAGNEDLERIESAGTELTSEFVTAFNNMSPEERNIWVEDARRKMMASEFGWAASFLDDAELGPILRQASQERWVPEKLLMRLRQTKWWKARDENQRAWDQGIALDPPTYNAQIDRRRREVKEVAAGMNLALSEDQLTTLSSESLRSGWDATQTINAIANEGLRGDSFGPDIRFGITGRTIRQLASEYAVPLSDSGADDWAKKLATGSISQTDFENWVRVQAKSLYPSLSNDIDRGVTVKSLVDPYRQVAASTLGIPSAEVDFADPRWNAALNFDDGKGRRMMTLFEWGRHLRSDEQYGYERTPDARDKAYKMVDRLGRMFGVTA